MLWCLYSFNALSYASTRICRSGTVSLLLLLQKRNTITLQQNLPQLLNTSTLQINLLSLIQRQVHELVEADDDAFDAGASVFVEPDGDGGFGLEESEDLVYGEGHYLLFGRHDWRGGVGGGGAVAGGSFWLGIWGLKGDGKWTGRGLFN